MRVLIFDTWRALNKEMTVLLSIPSITEVRFVHVEAKLKKYASLPIQERIKGLGASEDGSIISAEDFENYGYDVGRCLRNIKPDLVLFLSLHNPEQRYFNYSARKLGYKTALLMHGVILDDGIVSKSVSSTYEKIRSKAYRRLFFYYFFYFKLLKESNAREFISLIADGFKILFNRTSYHNRPSHKVSVHIDGILFSRVNDVLFYERYGGRKIPFAFQLWSIDILNLALGPSVANLKVKKDKAIFYAQPLYCDGLLSLDNYLDVIRNVRSTFEERKVSFMVKPHPREVENIYSEFDIFRGDVNEALGSGGFFVTVNSTAILLPLFLGYPCVSLFPLFFGGSFLPNFGLKDSNTGFDCASLTSIQFLNFIDKAINSNFDTTKVNSVNLYNIEIDRFFMSLSTLASNLDA